MLHLKEMTVLLAILATVYANGFEESLHRLPSVFSGEKGLKYEPDSGENNGPLYAEKRKYPPTYGFLASRGKKSKGREAFFAVRGKKDAPYYGDLIIEKVPAYGDFLDRDYYPNDQYNEK